MKLFLNRLAISSKDSLKKTFLSCIIYIYIRGKVDMLPPYIIVTVEVCEVIWNLEILRQKTQAGKYRNTELNFAVVSKEILLVRFFQRTV